MDINSLTLTPIERRILQLLDDGLTHQKDDLRACLHDDAPDTPTANISFHIRNIRKKIRRHGHDIVCEPIQGLKMGYRHVRLLRGSDD